METPHAKELFLAVKKGTIEESKMLQLLTYAIKHEGTCICYGSGRIDVRTIDLASKYPVISKEINEWHKGWDNMRDAHFVDFYNLSCAERPFALEQAGFSKWIIDFWNSKDAYKYKNRFTSAIHVDLNDGTWEELIFNQTRPEDHFVQDGISIHVEKERNKTGVDVKAVITQEGKYELYIACQQSPTREMIKRYISYHSIMQVFNQMSENGETEKVWNDTERLDSIIKQTTEFQEHISKANEIWDCLTHGIPIKRVLSHSNDFDPQNKNDIKTYIRKNKGWYFSGQCFCRLCNSAHTRGYRYYIGGTEVIICKYCEDELKNKKPWAKEILVNMGGKR